jgi:predicted transcriptional regulator
MTAHPTPVVRVRDVMKKDFDLLDGTATVKDALLAIKHPETGMILINKRSDDDEHGVVIFADIAKKVLGLDRSPERVNLYELMSKPVLGVPARMDIRYCARLMERFGITRAPVLESEAIVGVVSYDDLVLRGLREALKATA